MTPTNTQGSEQELRERVKQCFVDTEMQHDEELTLFDTEETINRIVALIKSDREATTVNRFEVINHLSDGSGRVVVVWNGEPFKVETSLQDQGQTLKVFLTDVAHLSKEDSNHA